jgi:hypothetical protein
MSAKVPPPGGAECTVWRYPIGSLATDLGREQPSLEEVERPSVALSDDLIVRRDRQDLTRSGRSQTEIPQSNFESQKGSLCKVLNLLCGKVAALRGRLSNQLHSAKAFFPEA